MLQYDAQINSRLPTDMVEEIKFVARKERISFSETLRELLMIGLNRKAAERPTRMRVIRRPKKINE